MKKIPFSAFIKVPEKVTFLYVVACLFLIHKLFIMMYTPISGDEAYHWEWSRNLALGYYDHPPMTAWLIFLVTKLLGSTPFTIRLVAFFCYLGALIYLFLLTKEFSGKRAGIISVFIFFSIPLISAFSVMITTDPPILLFWSASLYYLYKSIFMNEKYWIVSALFVGCALLSKFLAMHIIFSLFLFIALSPNRKKILKSKYFYAFLALVLLIFSPVFYWNYNHDWATFYFNFSKRHTFKLNFVYLFDYVFVQFVLIGITIPIAIIVIFLLNRKNIFSKSNYEKNIFFIVFGLFIIAFFLPFSLTRRIGAHWPACGYLSIIALASMYLSKINQKILVFIIAFPLLTTTILSFFIIYPHKIPHNLSYKPQKRATTSRLVHFYGWKQASHILNAYLDDMPDETRIIGESYGVASIMALYSGRSVPSHVLNLYGIHGLNYYFWDKFEKTVGINGVYVTTARDILSPKLTKNESFHLSRAFERHELQAPLKIFVDNKHVRTFLFVKCFNLVAPLTEKNPIR